MCAPTNEPFPEVPASGPHGSGHAMRGSGVNPDEACERILASLYEAALDA